MALMMKRLSFLRHILMPRLISAAAPTTPSLSYFSALFSTLAQNNITPPRSPFADFAASTFNLYSADIARLLKIVPSLDKPKTLQNVERLVHVFTKYGCTQHHIASIMKSQPMLLTINAEKLVEPKIELLKDLGIDEKDLSRLLFKAPRYLCSSLQEGILPNIAFLRSLFQSQNMFLRAVKLNPHILTYSAEKTLRPSVAFWEGFGFQREELAKFLSSKPYLLRNPSMTPAKVDLIRKMGLCKESKNYKTVLSVVAPTRIETLESKIDNLRQWGLLDEEIWRLFRNFPSVFSLSNDKLSEKMGFVVRTLELPPNSVATHSVFLRCSLEKVLKPRFAVFQHMKFLNGVEHLKSKQLSSIIAMSEANFVNRILKGHPELETVCALHKKAIPNV